MEEKHYQGSDASEALAFFMDHRQDMRALRRVIVGPEGTIIQDINGEAMQLDGMTLGKPELEALLIQAGASFIPATLHDPPGGNSGTKEFQITKQDPWGHDRVM